MRWALSWLCFGLGHATSWVAQSTDWDRLYALYGRLMAWSYNLQGDSSWGPWKRAAK